MNKKLLAVAVAGALAAPGVAFAQASSVTITGVFKVGLEGLQYSGGRDPNTRLNTSQMRVVDNSSQIHFVIVEALGNDLEAIAKLDVRFAPDQNSNLAAGTPSAFSASIGSGNTWVGLRSKSFGALTMGRWDLHYNVLPDDTAAKAAALGSWSVALMDYMQNGIGGNQAIANATRTQNVVKWDSPNWGGFSGIVAWSANPIGSGLVGGSEGDMTSFGTAAALATATGPAVGTGTFTNSRKGDGWNINPSYTNGPFQVGYSYWRAKADAPTVTLVAGNPTAISFDQRGDMLYGYYKFGGFKVGLAWNRSRLNTPFDVGGVSSGTMVAQRDAWSVPLSYTFGPHTIMGHYTKANKIKSDVNGTETDNTGAKMVQLAYLYDFSKRTSVGFTYSKISNDQNASYNLFTSQALGSNDASTLRGESPRLLQATIRHAF
jgi:general bacterial porin, GBP family